jgi:hypothetical protein
MFECIEYNNQRYQVLYKIKACSDEQLQQIKIRYLADIVFAKDGIFYFSTLIKDAIFEDVVDEKSKTNN